MRVIIITISFLLFASNSFAIDLAKTLNKIGNGGDPVKEVSGNINKKLDKVVKKFEGKIDGYEKEINGEINKYKEKVKEAESYLNKIKEIKNKANYYINLAKIVIAVLSSGIVVLLFMMWRIWRNVVGLKKVIRNVTNYDDINKRLEKVEKLVTQQK